MQLHLKSSLDLNPALNLEWNDFSESNIRKIVDENFWLRFKDSKLMVHYSPFKMVFHNTLKKNYRSMELEYDDRILLQAWSHNYEYTDAFLVELDLDDLEYALVPLADDILDWTTLKLEDDPDGEFEFLCDNAPPDVYDTYFIDHLDESQLVLWWPYNEQGNINFIAGEPYYHNEYSWHSIHLLDKRNDYWNVVDFKNGDKWIYMFQRNA